RGVAHEVPELTSIGAGGVEADERPAVPAFLEIHAVQLAIERQVDIAPDHGLEHGSARAARAPRRCQDVLDIAEVGHEGPKVALHARHAELLHREDGVVAGLWERLPEAHPT